MVEKTLENICKQFIGDRKLQVLLIEDRGVSPALLSLVTNVLKEDFTKKEPLEWFRQVLRWMTPIHLGVNVIDKSSPLFAYFEKTEVLQ